MKIDYSLYHLLPLKQLNNFSSLQQRFGVYLKINDVFFLDYHPWEEFGDLSVSDFLLSLKQNGLSEHLHSLLQLEMNKDLIVNHPFKNTSLNQKIVKIKVLQDLSTLAEQLNLLDETKKYRFDFNNKFTLEEILLFWDALSYTNKSKIDYFEDPCTNENDCWSKLKHHGIPLACDRNPKSSTYYDVEVFKPNAEPFQKNSRPQIFSSYMGGDLGRFHAYLSLMHFGDLNLYHGIDTPNIYNNQLELFKMDAEFFYINHTAVIQMYQQLKELSWSAL